VENGSSRRPCGNKIKYYFRATFWWVEEGGMS